ncbi:MAG: DNA cytosine methyltransferase [Candidatus Hodarchaeales archaeon]
MRILDLFCGCGGFALGFLLASRKFEVLLGVDNNPYTVKSYQKNVKGAKVLQKDVRSLHSLDILDLTNQKSPDIIIASPPCESFSAANQKRMKKGYDQLYQDENGRLVLEAIRLILDLKPEYFFIENVTQLASLEIKQLIEYEFRNSEFKEIYFNILNSEMCNVPSKRRRVFISNIQLNNPANPTTLSVNDAFKNLPDAFDDECQEFPFFSSKIEKKIIGTPAGGALVYFRGSKDSTFRNLIRLRLDEPSPTVMGKSRFIHPIEPRLCTVREHARLMGYPDSAQFSGPIEWKYNQVGESVPPPLSKYIAENLLKESF